jgi:hypothetical protein
MGRLLIQRSEPSLGSGQTVKRAVYVNALPAGLSSFLHCSIGCSGSCGCILTSYAQEPSSPPHMVSCASSRQEVGRFWPMHAASTQNACELPRLSFADWRRQVLSAGQTSPAWASPLHMVHSMLWPSSDNRSPEHTVHATPDRYPLPT